MGEQDLTSLVSVFEDFFTSIYKDKINIVLASYPTVRSINVDFQDLDKFDTTVADQLLSEPEVVTEAAEEAIQQMKLSLPPGVGDFRPHVRFYNAPNAEVMIEKLSSKRLNELVCFKGIVTKRTDVMHKVKKAHYTCQACGEQYNVLVTRNFKPPRMCTACKKLALVPNEEKSEFTDMQKAEVQDLLEKVSGGAPAAKMELWIEDDLVNHITPGENIQVTGIMRIKPSQNTRQKTELVFNRYVEVLHVESLKRDFEEITLTKEDVQRIKEMSRQKDITERIFASIAPAIYGYKEVKKALALQLFGGTKGKMMRGDAAVRDDIHILLIGDPGIAKTRFLNSAAALAPKSMYVSGKSVSGVGLTASAEKDELGDGGWTLKAGALVLASGGVGAIDEFDKIDDEDRASLHEVMESQTVSIAKAGIVAKFRAKTAIVAAANPKHGRFNQTKNLADQFDVPPSLLSRFDLLFPILDVLDEEKDLSLAEHILSSHIGAAKGMIIGEDEKVMDRDILRKYIAYARRYVRPVLTDSAKDRIKEFYLDLRRRGKSSGSVPITPRYLEGLVRLSEAHAKMRLSETVELVDAEVSVGLLDYVLKKVLTDQETGRFDVDIITTGKARSQVEKIETLLDILREKTREQEAVPRQEVLDEAESAGLDAATAKRVLTELMRKGEVYEKEPGWIALVGNK
ncbi:AAA domain-containing protein [Candidatus Micrarchaeota archaeon]|nr:AAA domain-containing protein [Candidatus Micrarchaeota archaeon]MBD3418211.1 AAA domain-containing protein [Candidatus Micrarchaeota archaeon]